MVFWEVDTQADFMLPGGKLYVAGAETIIPNLKRLVDAARSGRVLLISDTCVHSPDDEEFRDWPPHCLRGTPGAEIIPEARASRFYSVPNRAGAARNLELTRFQQVNLEKQTLNVFDNPNTDVVLDRLQNLIRKDAEFAVFGVVTEYCVRLAARGLIERGRRVAVVTDAIAALDRDTGNKTLDELASLGAGRITTDEALALVG